MKKCRLKIITANIINDIDTPQIHYVSQNYPINVNKLFNEINNDYNNNNFLKTKETTANNYTPIDDDIKFLHNQTEIQNLILNEQDEQYIKKIKENLEINDNNNFKQNYNIDINDLFTISNNNIYQQKNVNKNTKNYPHDIKTKKNQLLRNGNQLLFKNRTKNYIKTDKSTSNNKIKNKSNSRNKSKTFNNSSKKPNKTSTHINAKKNSCNLNKKIIKATKNNLNENQKPEKEKKKFKLSSKTNKNIQTKNNNNNNNNSNNNILPKNNSNNNSLLNNSNSSQFEFALEVKEKCDNTNNILNYKERIEELLFQEYQLNTQKEQIKQQFEEKLKPLREINKKLLEENNEELSIVDELQGEYIVLKNQYENLLNQLNKNKSSVNNNMNNNVQKIYKEDFSKKQIEIDNNYKLLEDCLKNGDILLITKPINYEILSDNEIKNISLMIRGFLYDFHLYQYEKLINIIWKNDKPIQIIYFLVKEFMEFFKLNKRCDRNKLINYFYTICQNYTFISKENFIVLLQNKIGIINKYNRFLYFNKLNNLYKNELSKLHEYLSTKDVFNIGIVQYNKFILGLEKVGIDINKKMDDMHEDSEEIFEFLIFCMKRDRNILLQHNNNFVNNNYNDKEENSNKNDTCEIYNLFYGNLIDFENEYNDDNIDDYIYTIRNYMKAKEISSAKILFDPLLIKENIISLNNIEYVDTIVLNKYLRNIDIINQKEKIYFPTYEDELVDINQLISDIDNQIQQNIKQSPQSIKKKATDFINEILDLNFI